MAWGFSNIGSTGIKNGDALLRVRAPSGSTVSITKGSITKTASGREESSDSETSCYIFIISPSQFDLAYPWVVRATLDTKSTTTMILIDSSKEYNVELMYNVPLDYQEVEYLESTGSQYLTTGWTQPSNWTSDGQVGLIEVEFMKTSSSNTHITGSSIQDGSGWSAEYEIGIENGSQILVNYGHTASTIYRATTPASLNTKYKVSVYNTGLSFETYVDDVFINRGSSSSQRRNGYSFDVFRVRNGSSYNFISGRIYHYLISKSGVPIVDLYPCYRKTDFVPGMWDNVGKVFRTNLGNGSFVVGPNV